MAFYNLFSHNIKQDGYKLIYCEHYVEPLSLQCVCFSLQPNGNAYGDGHGLVTIRMTPDSQGRFGFNVKVCNINVGNITSNVTLSSAAECVV